MCKSHSLVNTGIEMEGLLEQLEAIGIPARLNLVTGTNGHR